MKYGIALLGLNIVPIQTKQGCDSSMAGEDAVSTSMEY
jgi:hypothetical protein